MSRKDILITHEELGKVSKLNPQKAFRTTKELRCQHSGSWGSWGPSGYITNSASNSYLSRCCDTYPEKTDGRENRFLLALVQGREHYEHRGRWQSKVQHILLLQSGRGRLLFFPLSPFNSVQDPCLQKGIILPTHIMPDCIALGCLLADSRSCQVGDINHHRHRVEDNSFTKFNTQQLPLPFSQWEF